MFISAGIAAAEPSAFGEPGLFLVAPDSSVFYAAVNFDGLRPPQLDDVLADAGRVCTPGRRAYVSANAPSPARLIATRTGAGWQLSLCNRQVGNGSRHLVARSRAL